MLVWSTIVDVTEHFNLEKASRQFEARYPLILEAARRYAPGSDLAYDVAQQTFVIFIEGVKNKGWNTDKNLNSLLYTIAKNVAKKMWEKELKHSATAMRTIGERLIRAQERLNPFDFGITEKNDVGQERLDALKQCMAKLDAKSLEYLEFHYCQRITLEKIAERKSINAFTVRKFFSRLRLRLRDCIEKSLSQN